MTVQELRAYESARKKYEEIQRRKEELTVKDKRLLKRITDTEVGRYDVGSRITMMIAEVHNNNAINAFDTIFKLGFMRGEKSMKNKMKRDNKMIGKEH